MVVAAYYSFIYHHLFYLIHHHQKIMPTFASLGFAESLQSRWVAPPQQGTTPLATPYALLLRGAHWHRRVADETKNEEPASLVPDNNEMRAWQRSIAWTSHRQTACGRQQAAVLRAVHGDTTTTTTGNDHDDDDEANQKSNEATPTPVPSLFGSVAVADYLAWHDQLCRPVWSAGGVLDDLVTVGTNHHKGWTWGWVYQVSVDTPASRPLWESLTLHCIMGTVDAVTTVVYYLVPAYRSPTTLAQALAAVHPHDNNVDNNNNNNNYYNNFLAQVHIDTYRDNHELQVILAYIEASLQAQQGRQPWCIVVEEPVGTASSSSSSSHHPWHRLVRLYHGVVVVATPTNTVTSATTIHLQVQDNRLVTCIAHPEATKVGQSVVLVQADDFL